MENSLNIPAAGALDFVSLGALVHRLDPGIVPFRKAHQCDAEELIGATALRPHPRVSVSSSLEERPLGRVSKDAGPAVASWFETALRASSP